jgi:hypothetical protein
MSYDLNTGEEIDERPLWKREWIGMPEFNADKEYSYATVIVRFENVGDLKRFEAAIGQQIKIPETGKKQKSIWYPKKETETSERYF